MSTASLALRGFRAFSLIETVLVIVILGIIAAIAVPRMSVAASNSVVAAATANVSALERAIALYAAEHNDRTPAHEADGGINTDEATFAKRLVQTSNAVGDTGVKLMFGPYLRELPHNPVNGRRRIRIDGAPAGANTHGWRFDSIARIIEPDDAYVVLVLAGKPATLADSKRVDGADAAIEAAAAAAAATVEK